MLEPKQPLEDKMHNIMELFLGTQELLPIHAPLPLPPPSPPKGIMEAARLPVDRFLVYAEEGVSTAPTAITIKK